MKNDEIKDYVFDAVYQYFDTHNSLSKEKFFDYWDRAIKIYDKE